MTTAPLSEAMRNVLRNAVASPGPTPGWCTQSTDPIKTCKALYKRGMVTIDGRLTGKGMLERRSLIPPSINGLRDIISNPQITIEPKTDIINMTDITDLVFPQWIGRALRPVPPADPIVREWGLDIAHQPDHSAIGAIMTTAATQRATTLARDAILDKARAYDAMARDTERNDTSRTYYRETAVELYKIANAL